MLLVFGTEEKPVSKEDAINELSRIPGIHSFMEAGMPGPYRGAMGK